MVQEQIDLVISTLCTTNALMAALCLGTACAGTWHFWELTYVEKKATKHKRRRKQRKNAIPWDKIKVRKRSAVESLASAALAVVYTAGRRQLQLLGKSEAVQHCISTSCSPGASPIGHYFVSVATSSPRVCSTTFSRADTCKCPELIQ